MSPSMQMKPTHHSSKKFAPPRERDIDEELFLEKTLSEIRQTLLANSTGHLSQIALSVFLHPGKMLRSKMIYRLGRILDVPLPLLVAWAATIEFLHNATLVHDDLQDGDHVRRGQPTIWSQHGTHQAINVGDLLILIAIQPILNASMPSALLSELCSLFSQSSAKLVNGQSFEAELNRLEERKNWTGDYLFCARQKTAALFSFSAEGVALLAKTESQFQSDISDLFSRLGILFQIQDDILDLYGDKQRDVIGCDIREGKVSILVAHHLEKNPEDFDFIKQVLTQPRDQTTDEDVRQVMDLFLRKNTLQNALAHLEQISLQITQHPALKNRPKLDRFAKDLLFTLLEPIHHLHLKSRTIG